MSSVFRGFFFFCWLKFTSIVNQRLSLQINQHKNIYEDKFGMFLLFPLKTEYSSDSMSKFKIKKDLHTKLKLPGNK